MLNRTIVINPIEPALLSVRSPFGVALDLSLFFQSQQLIAVNPDTLMPQLALMPRSAGGIFATDVETTSAEAGIASVTVPGPVLTDPAGFTIELYQRRAAANPDDPPVPTGLLAKGVLALDGSAYSGSSVLAPITVPVVVGPVGPMGPQGEPGTRGSIWFTGDGDPTGTAGFIDGDMYLNNLNGDVWRFNGEAWMLGSF